jgi:sulfate adenylyltransferase subunit 2
VSLFGDTLAKALLLNASLLPVESDAGDVAGIVIETATTTITERGATRLDDQTSEASMEQRKKEGYF